MFRPGGLNEMRPIVNAYALRYAVLLSNTSWIVTGMCLSRGNTGV